MPYRFPSFVTVSFSHQPPKRDKATPDKTRAASTASNLNERRVHKRFVTNLHGDPCFWAFIGDERLPLDDLSLKGFALPAPLMFTPGAQFYFILQREGESDTVRGRAEVTGVFRKDSLSAGCRIIQFEGDSKERLHDWLVAHVIHSATVQISEKEAVAIVSGHSLV